MTDVAGLVLAAGAGRRLGRPKPELRLGGSTFLERAVAALLDGGCASPVCVVGPPGGAAVSGADVVTNEDWAEGMGSSLRLGLAALASHGAGAAVVTLVDTPLVAGPHVARLLAAWQAGTRLAVATYAGQRRTPVLLGAEHWAAVGSLARGDVGARAFLETHPDLVVPVECGDLGPWLDVDTPTDLAALPEG